MAQTTKKKTTKKRKYSKRARRLQREMFLSALLLVGAIVFIVKNLQSPSYYQLVIYQENQEMEEVQYYTSFKTAKREMKQLIEDGAYNPAVLDEDGKILAIRYGIVNFHTKTYGENSTYTRVADGKQGYTNGCYGADGAYLDTDDDGTKVLFKQSGAIGWISLDDVELYNYSDREQLQSMNYYMVNEDAIVHYGTSDLFSLDGVFAINIGKNEENLTPGTYYSYDGHYFYESYPKMIDDYRQNTYEHSVNSTQPHDNYFQYLTHRSKSSYVSKDINWYISNYLGYTSKPTADPAGTYESQLYDEGYSFVEAQNTYGTNAMMMLALAINESGFGRSQIAIEKNNLFGHAAYDSAPNENATGYVDVAASIRAHASIFLNQGYLNPCDSLDSDSKITPSTCLNAPANRYMGGYFGDKGSGMNVNYASDPYWGEKAAQYYRNMDEILGGSDEHRYTIKVLENKEETPLYGLPNTSSKIIYYTPKVERYAMIIIDELEGEEIDGNTTWYKVQSDAVLNQARNSLVTQPENYNFKNDIVYVPAAYFTK